MAEIEKKEVFISYSNRNADLAQLFCNQLEGAGVPCWIAPRDIPSGGKWAGAITDGLANSKVFALLVSEASVNSGEVEKEIDLANSNKHITIIPIRIENVSLQGAFQYHLSNKQWINALGDDKFTRFVDAVNAICKVIGKEGIDSVVAGGGVIGIAHQLANELNSKFRDRLGIINSMFSARQTDEHVVQIFFPLRLGATGVDLIIQFDDEKSEMCIYADAASDGDSLKVPFRKLINGKFTELLPNLKITSGARRWNFVELVPIVALTSPLTKLESVSHFGLFKANVLEFTDKVMPAILDWAVYAVKVGEAIDELESRLKILFPGSEWKVGAPERERLRGFTGGAIYVYKEKWLSREGDNNGLLSMAIQGNAFLDYMWIGIVKHNGWLELGNWEEKLRCEANKILGKTNPDPPGHMFVWRRPLDEQWSRSGIYSAEFLWDDVKLKAFVEYCVGRFEQMKKFENLLDEACTALPALQIRPSSEFLPETLKSWAGNEFYIENRMREIAEKLQNEYSGRGLSATYRFLGGWQWNDVYLVAKSGKFDAAVAFRVWELEWRSDILNIDPPDFETPKIIEYFKHFHDNIKLQDGGRQVKLSLDGGTLKGWMDQYEEFVIQQAAAIAPALVGLKQHLDRVVDLTKSVEKEIRVSDDGWCFKNEAVDLERFASLAFWHKNWLTQDSKETDYPPIVIRIVPDELCFENLKLVVTSASGDMAGLDRIVGACDYAFGQSEYPPSNGFWSKPLDEPHRYTGGSRFDKPLVDGSEGGDFINYIRGITESFKKMEPIIRTICLEQKKKDSIDFNIKYEKFIKGITSAIKQHFPEKEDWQVVARAPMDKCCGAYGIIIFKNSWRAAGADIGSLCFLLQNGDVRFEKLYYGIWRSSNQFQLSAEQRERIRQKLTELFGIGENTEGASYPYWRNADSEYSSTGGANKNLPSGDRLERMHRYYADDVFLKMKKATPVIDEIVSELKSKSEVKPT